jgi:hypothetical protein
MCFSNPEQPKPRPAPAITPPPKVAPPPTPSSPSPRATASQEATTAEARRKKAIRATRYGILSTIKTSPLGIVGTGDEGKKQTLGS